MIRRSSRCPGQHHVREVCLEERSGGYPSAAATTNSYSPSQTPLAGSYELSVRGGVTSIYKTLAMKPLLDWYQQLTKRKNDIDKAATPTCSLNVRSR